MRISENPIIHYGALAGAAATMLGLVTTVGFNVTPPWATPAQAAEIPSKTMADFRAKYDATLERLQADQLQIKLRDLDAALIDTKERACKAQKAGNAEAFQFANDRIRFLKEQYLATTDGQRGYDMPDCKELGFSE